MQFRWALRKLLGQYDIEYDVGNDVLDIYCDDDSVVTMVELEGVVTVTSTVKYKVTPDEFTKLSYRRDLLKRCWIISEDQTVRLGITVYEEGVSNFEAVLIGLLSEIVDVRRKIESDSTLR